MIAWLLLTSATILSSVPDEHHVHILERAGSGHVDLAANRLLRGRTVETDGALERTRRDLFLDRNGRAQTRRAEEVVTAPMPGRTRNMRLTGRLNFLRKARQRVVLANDADHRRTRSELGSERRRQPPNGSHHTKAVLFGVRRESTRRLRFAQRGFRKLPDLVAQADQLGSLTLHRGHHSPLRILNPGERRGQRKKQVVRLVLKRLS
jgi:hypothetical protein